MRDRLGSGLGARMLYRYRMHWVDDSTAPLGPGRPLFARTPAEAIIQAADLWKAARANASAFAYCIVDTEDGTVLFGSSADQSLSAAA
jgi:D-alanyl-D-alanine carboxypeptidase